MAKNYVAVRVTNMAGVDLNRYVFDYDLTFAVLLMNADGTVYHRYGSRATGDAHDRLDMKALAKLLKDTLDDHAAYVKNPSPPKALPKRTVADIPPFAKQMEKNKPNCIHCHMVNDAERLLAKEQKKPFVQRIWMWPRPERLGLSLNVGDATLIKDVARSTPAAAAGLKANDRILRAGGSSIRSEADLQWVLENMSDDGGKLEVEYQRGTAAPAKATLALGKKWKETTPAEVSWRPYMWGLRPNPGFGGKDLTDDERKPLGLKPGAFAFRVNYLITWGDEAHLGRNAQKAGVQKGDILVGVAGLSDFKGSMHFQTWFRLTQKTGATVELSILRNGKPMKLKLDVIE